MDNLYNISTFCQRRQWHPTPVLLPGKIPQTEEPGRLLSMGSQRVGHYWATSPSLFTFMHWRRKWQPTPVLAWRIPGMGEPGWLPSMGSHRVRHDWSDLAAAALSASIRHMALNIGTSLVSFFSCSSMSGADNPPVNYSMCFLQASNWLDYLSPSLASWIRIPIAPPIASNILQHWSF